MKFVVKLILGETDHLPWLWWDLAFQAWQQRQRLASAFRCRWCVVRCRSTEMTWSSTATSEIRNLENILTSKLVSFTCCGVLKVGVIFPKLTELFSKWCDCWGDDDDDVWSCRGVCGETGWMMWPLLLMLLLLFAVFGLMLRVEFWAGELLPLPAIETKKEFVVISFWRDSFINNV